jgi:DNA invertase Pin-like site-specific DNA recombinase
MCTREGMAIAKAKGKLRGKQPKLSAAQQRHLLQLHREGKHTIVELAELFNVSRPTVYRVIDRARAETREMLAGVAPLRRT